MTTRFLCLLVLSLLLTGCYPKWEDQQLWVCQEVNTAVGTVPACQPTGVRIP